MKRYRDRDIQIAEFSVLNSIFSFTGAFQPRFEPANLPNGDVAVGAADDRAAVQGDFKRLPLRFRAAEAHFLDVLAVAKRVVADVRHAARNGRMLKRRAVGERAPADFRHALRNRHAHKRRASRKRARLQFRDAARHGRAFYRRAAHERVVADFCYARGNGEARRNAARVAGYRRAAHFQVRRKIRRERPAAKTNAASAANTVFFMSFSL